MLVMSMVMSFCAVLFPVRCLGWDWDLIESVSEGFPTYSLMFVKFCSLLVLWDSILYST